jgi:hypothetical protein
MRLKPEKIEHLANIIFDSLAANKEITLSEGRDKIVGTIRRLITEDMLAEDEIEEAARALLEEHKDQISRQGASYEKLFNKAKQKIALERKMVL